LTQGHAKRGPVVLCRYRSFSAQRPGGAPGEKTFARPSLGFFCSACLPPFRGYAPVA